MSGGGKAAPTKKRRRDVPEKAPAASQKHLRPLPWPRLTVLAQAATPLAQTARPGARNVPLEKDVSRTRLPDVIEGVCRTQADTRCFSP